MNEALDLSKAIPDNTGPAIGFLAGDAYRERLAMHMHFPSIAHMSYMYSGQKLVICGGAPSIGSTIPAIRRHAVARDKDKPVQLVAVNRTHDWLIARGIVPTFAALCDPREHVVDYITPRNDVIYFLNAGCHPKVFERFLKAKAAFAVWVAVNDEEDKTFIAEKFPPTKGYAHSFVTGSSTVGLRMQNLGATLGFKEYELHGFDSCAKPLPLEALADYAMSGKIAASMYAYEKKESMAGMIDRTAVAGDGQQFRYFGNVNMQQQLNEFPEFVARAVNHKMHHIDGAGTHREIILPQRITVAGDGVLPWMAWKAGMHVDPERMADKYAGRDIIDYRFGA